MTDTIIARIEGRAGRLSLNRPKAIHALDLDMVPRDDRARCRTGCTSRR